jgi:DNA-binding NtrC family response regulator
MEWYLGRHKILIVDDHQAVSRAVKIALEDVYDVTEANCAIRALRYLSENKADLVILDINMPGMDGIETLGEIKKRHSDTVVIMLSSCASMENINKATSFGAYGFISKPFDLESLRNYIDTALNVIKKDNVLHKVPVTKRSSIKRS